MHVIPRLQGSYDLKSSKNFRFLSKIAILQIRLKKCSGSVSFFFIKNNQLKMIAILACHHLLYISLFQFNYIFIQYAQIPFGINAKVYFVY